MIYRILSIVLIIAATVVYSLYSKKSLESQLVSDIQNTSVLAEMPKAEFTTLEGKSFPLESLFQDQRVDLLIVHFWGTWCAPCEAELPELLSFIKRFAGQMTIKFVLVAANDDALKIKKHLKSLTIPEKAALYWLMDNNNVHRDIFGTTRVPETYVFSSGKATLRKFLGPQEWNKPLFYQTFDELIEISSRKL